MASRSRIGEILIKAGVLDELQLRSARAQHEQWGGRLGKLVADMGLADEDTIADAIARSAGIPRVNVGHLPKDPGALAKLDVRYAEEHGVLPVALKDNGKTLVLAMADPTDLDEVDAAASRARVRITPVVAGETEIQHAILRYYKGQEPAKAEPPRARQAFRRATEELPEPGGDEDEFKITDMSGKTMVRHIGDIEAEGAMTDPAQPRAAPPAAGSAASMLDEMFQGGAPDPAGFTPEELARLSTLRQNQQKSAAVLRAVIELLQEKGYATPRDIAARVKP